MNINIDKKNIIFIPLLVLTGVLSFINCASSQDNDQRFVSHIIDPHKDKIHFYWKTDEGANFQNFSNLKNWLSSRGDSLVFAMNGGMYNQELAPVGSYIERGKVLAELDTALSGYGNFYMKPNGVFYLLNDHTPVICTTEDFKADANVLYATQSGPLLLIDGQLHHRFKEGSENVHIRNGVGILPNGNIVFAMSKDRVNFYDFATYFKKQGCEYALYLDGLVSRTYLPSKNWVQLDGNFGVIIGQIK